MGAGFKHISCAVPDKIQKFLFKIGINTPEKISNIGVMYFKFMLIMEKILFVIPNKKIRRYLAIFFRKNYLFADNIFLIAQK